jgi:predicted MFS family arabinose efflux permease
MTRTPLAESHAPVLTASVPPDWIPGKLEPDRWYVLGVLTLVYALNIADRYSISTLIEPIKAELKLSDASVGFLTGVALALFYVTLGIPLATLADRANRRNIVAASLALWSLMTTVCGLTQTYWQLLLARIGVGVGEAGGTPPSTSIIADKFPAAQRPMAQTIFAIGASLGAWLGSSFAGQIADALGWRAALIALGMPGLALAILLWLTVKEPRRGTLDPPTVDPHPASFAQTLRFIPSQRALVHLLLGGTIFTFWSWGLIWWTPAFLARSHNMTVGQAGAALGPIHLFAGTATVLVTSWIMMRRKAADPSYVTRLVAIVTLATIVPSLLAYWIDRTDVAIAMLWIFVPVLYLYIGPTLGLLQNLVPAGMRAQIVAVFVFTANVANLVVAPQLIGLISDGLAASYGTEALRYALILITPTGLWAAYHYWTAARTIREDTARVTDQFSSV